MTTDTVVAWLIKENYDYRSVETSSASAQMINMRKPSKQLDAFLFGSKKTHWPGYVYSAREEEKIDKANEKYVKEKSEEIKNVKTITELDQFKIDEEYRDNQQLKDLIEKIKKFITFQEENIRTGTSPEQLTDRQLELAKITTFEGQTLPPGIRKELSAKYNKQKNTFPTIPVPKPELQQAKPELTPLIKQVKDFWEPVYGPLKTNDFKGMLTIKKLKLAGLTPEQAKQLRTEIKDYGKI